MGTIESLAGGTPRSSNRSREGVVHGHHGTGVATCEPLLHLEQPAPDPPASAAKAAPEELRHRLVQVEDDGHTGQSEWRGREDEEVRQRMDLDEREAPPYVGARQRDARSDEERQVLAQVDRERCALVALDAEPADVDPVDGLALGIFRTAEGEDLDVVTGRGERLGLAPYPRILLVVGMGEHRDAPRRGGRHGRWALHGRAERTARAARTPRVTLRCRWI